MKTQSRLVEIKGHKEFRLETTKEGKETKISEIQVTAFPSKTHELKHVQVLEDFNPEDEIVQKNTPIARTEHTMAKLNDEEMIMIGGLTLPKGRSNYLSPG